MPLQAWLVLAYLGIICTAVGYALWYFAIERAPVNLVGLTVFAQPVAGLLLAAVWLGEPLHWSQCWGSVAIIVGLIIGLRPQTAARAPAVLTEPVEVE